MNYRVVLADDEPEVLRSIQRTLDWEKYGFSVVGAFLNGLDVLEFLENHDVDIVFTDIRMPFMDGIELMHKIKEKYPYIKLVIISGYDDFQYAKEALIHGVLDYILKPINAREMSEVLQKVKDKMDTELEEKQSIQKLRNLYLENQPIIRENERFQSDFRIVANFFTQKRKNKDYIPDDPTEIKYVDEVLKLLNVMTGDKRYEKIFQKKKGVRSMCDVAERLEKMGIVKGIEIGRLEGKEEGKVEGKAEGKAEGILEGKMQVYRNLLKKGFTEKEAREITEIS